MWRFQSVLFVVCYHWSNYLGKLPPAKRSVTVDLFLYVVVEKTIFILCFALFNSFSPTIDRAWGHPCIHGWRKNRVPSFHLPTKLCKTPGALLVTSPCAFYCEVFSTALVLGITLDLFNSFGQNAFEPSGLRANWRWNNRILFPVLQKFGFSLKSGFFYDLFA